ncbi:DUF1624 domain-containing protein, partial [Candidatus Bathyarchaeota archaeon]|nr:DUF1624 domain-containing protein [Candidatus Bathyarchaeota archaeon]
MNQPVLKKKNARHGRIPTIDFLKGASIIMIFYAHISFSWMATDLEASLRLQWYLLDFFGPSMFLSLSMVGNMISLERNRARGIKKTFTGRTLLKASYLLIWGEIINILNVYNMKGYHFTAWNIITVIGLFSLLLPLILKLKAWM